MTVAYRQIATVFMATLAAAIFYLPGVPDHSRPLLAMALWSVMFFMTRGKTEGMGPRPQQPAWDDRDIGQKFSIIMFYVMILGVAGFFAVMSVRAAEGAIWSYATAALVGTLALWVVWRNWSNRNAR